MADQPGRTDRLSHLTASQRQAIRTVDRSVLVSAAAGAGKTTVLAERCVALVCDVPQKQRCPIDELLVVTFTDAAAAEMRSRIRSAIRQRCVESPGNGYLQQQLHLLDSASIGTIHAFCKTLIQRWFPQAQVDPQATILSAEEAELLRQEQLDALFSELYGRDDELAEAFRQIVDDYGIGNDRIIARMLLPLHDFLGSVANPDAWLQMAQRQVDVTEPTSLIANLHTIQSQGLREELAAQAEYAQHAAATIRRCWPIAGMHADGIDEHVGNLKQWLEALDDGPAESWQVVADEIRIFQFAKAKNRPRSLTDEEKVDFEAAKELRDSTKAFFTDRLQQCIGVFSADECRDGLTHVAPYVATLVQLVTEFDKRYRDAKSAQVVVDFNDLQRGGLRLLSENADPAQPSAVARQLQKRYRYVLVDEFQDLDPLQEAILRLVSRETADPPEGNLFAVGDIKQSIYRFRLAEPELFAARADEFATGSSIGELITLQENFRSRRGVIEAVNWLFRPLMSRAFGGSDYDTQAELHAGADYPEPTGKPLFDKPAVELHLLEPVTERTRLNEESANSDQEDPDEELEGIEREAYLIGRRIQQWMGDNPDKKHWHIVGKPATADAPPVTRPIEYRDIVILLRALPYKAEPIADLLRRMNIPVLLDRADASINSTEFRDCYSLLQLLDNRQQDIPLAAVLRSPLLGEPFNETELLAIRLNDRDVPFHEAVQRYTREGADATLRDRLKLVMAMLNRYRTRIQREPVADVLWDIYDQTQYLAYVSGLPDGVRRREHLVRLHELARQFGRFARQGLRRFLRFIEDMIERGQPPKQAATAAGDEDAVRIMSIHASKGLEFPVVILADLDKRFNLSDVRANVLFDRDLGIALRVTDSERRICYPTLLHQLSAQRSQRENLSEELRVLYVALTRAREHLLLVGCCSPKNIAMHARRSADSTYESGTIPRLQRETATHPLHWLLPAMGAAPGDLVCWPGQKEADQSTLFKVYAHDRKTTDPWRIPPPTKPERAGALRDLAELRPLPDEEHTIVTSSSATQEADRIVANCLHEYPGLELTTLPARVAVSELKRRWDTCFEADERRLNAHRHAYHLSDRRPVPVFASGGRRDDTVSHDNVPKHSGAVQRGLATHRFLQLVDLRRPCDRTDLELQHQALTQSSRLSVEESAAVMLEGAAWFFSTELGQRIRDRATDIRREVAFVSRIEPQHYDPLVTARDCQDTILVRGMVDLLLVDKACLEIVDYKTDAIDPTDCDARAETYRSQIESYATAMQAIYHRPVHKSWLAFLHVPRIIEVPIEG